MKDSDNIFFDYVSMFEEILEELERLNLIALRETMSHCDNIDYKMGYHSGVNAALQLIHRRYYGDDD